jgi:hypothetical protein
MSHTRGTFLAAGAPIELYNDLYLGRPGFAYDCVEMY